MPFLIGENMPIMIAYKNCIPRTLRNYVSSGVVDKK
jgi:hypothetical protein